MGPAWAVMDLQPGAGIRIACLLTPDNAPGPGIGLFIRMEYRSKHYTVVQGNGPHPWKWSVRLDEKTLKSGESKTRASAVINAVWLIDKALAPKKKLFQPDD